MRVLWVMTMSANCDGWDAAHNVTVWRQIRPLLKPLRFQDAASTGFAERAVRSFDPAYALDVLLSPEPSFFGHREVLFAGLSSWIIAPQSGTGIRRSMAATALWHLEEEEQLARECLADKTLADVYVRLAIDRRFFLEIYDPLFRMVPASSMVVQESVGLQDCANVDVMAKIMKVLHHSLAERSRNSRLKSPKLEDAYDIAADHGKSLGGRSRSLRHVHRLTRLYRRSAAFIYAASTIDCGNSKTLLSLMVNGEAHWEPHGRLLNELIGRAVSAAELLTQCKARGNYQFSGIILGSVKAHELPLPHIPNSTKAVILQSLKMKPRHDG